MGMFSIDYPKRPKGEEAFFNSGRAMQRDAAANMSGVRARIADVSDTTDERYRAEGKANADAWQAEAQPQYDSTRPRLSSFARAMQAGRGRVRSVLASGGAEDLRAIHNRVAIARQGSALRSGQSRDMGQMSAAQDALNAAGMQSKSMISNSLIGLGGTLLGYGAGAALNKWNAGKQLQDTMAQTGYDRVT